MEPEKLEAPEIVDIVEGTVEELKNEIRNRELTPPELEKVLEAEKKAKNRKTARNFLEREIEKSHEEHSVDTELSKQDVLELTSGTVEELKQWVKENEPGEEELQELLHYEKVAKNRKTAKEFLKNYARKKELKEDFEKARYDFHQLKKDLDRLEKEVEIQDIDFTELETEESGSGEEEEVEETGEDEDIEEEQEEESQEGKETEEQEEEPGEEKEEGEKEDESEEEVEDEEESGDEKSEKEKKQEIVEELGLDIDGEELEEISLEELEQIRDEKEERERLIEQLEDDFDREQLEKSSTEDLKKLKREISGGNTAEDDDSGGKTDEEIEQEAQEDLEMMMGAVKGDEDEEEDKDRFESIKNAKQRLKDIVNRSEEEEEEESEDLDDQKVLDLLEEYSHLDRHEALVKTAHVMKGYLEHKEGIDRELTYKELSENIEAENQNLQRLLEFFESMNIDQYTGHIQDDRDEVIEAAKKTVKEVY